MQPQIPFIGMLKEIERLHGAFRSGEPLLILGPQGCGKTRLIQQALAANPQVLYVAWAPTLHALLTSLARGLIAAGHAGFAHRAADPDAWLSAQTSVQLKTILWTALETSPVPIVIDGIAGAGFPTYRFLQRVYCTRGMALFAAARDTESLGTLSRLFWNPGRILQVPPLSAAEAIRLFDAAAAHFALHCDLEALRQNTLDSARGNPGQIVDMCRLASHPQYQAGRHIQFPPLRLDAVMKSGA